MSEGVADHDEIIEHLAVERNGGGLEYARNKAFDAKYLGRAMCHAVQLRVGCIF